MSTPQRSLLLHKIRGYYLQREITEPPRPEELALLDLAIVCPVSGRPGVEQALPTSWIPFPSLGAESLYVSPFADAHAVPTRFVQPILCRKRGNPGEDTGYVGVDSRILTGERLTSWPAPRPVVIEEHPEVSRPRYSLQQALDAMGLPTPLPEVQHSFLGVGPRVAIIDTSFGGWGVLEPAVDEGSLELTRARAPFHFPRSLRRPEPWVAQPGHGVRMARVVQAVAQRARLGLFETPLAQHSYAYTTDLAAALALAVGDWQADVVLVAQADGFWGMPAHLRCILRNAARHGRGGRGVAIICSVGRTDANRDTHDSAALAGDDFNAQPWVIPVSACSLDGSWYRVQGYPLSRLGPSVELCAPGDIVDLPGVGMADDASLAASLVAGTAARMLEHNAFLQLSELRAILRLTAELGPVDTAPRESATEAEGLDEWDRSGHNFKLGHGRVHAWAAWLAAGDPVCLALLGTRHPGGSGGRASLELEMARAWEARMQALASSHEQVREYLALRGMLVRLVTYDGALRDALFWLARHLLSVRRVRAPRWPRDDMDHGVLVDRGVHVMDELARALECQPEGEPWDRVRRWCPGFTRFLEDQPPQRLAEFFAETMGFESPTEG